MKVQAVSGFGVKGPACFALEIGQRRFLLDLGEGPDEGARPDLRGLGAVDAVLISHAHKDHASGLDRLDELGHPPVYATECVRSLLGIDHIEPLPLFGETCILGIPIRTGRNGHAPGGVWLRIGGEEGLLYGGDFSRESRLFPFDPFPTAAIAILDASYGSYDQPLAEGAKSIIAIAETGAVLLPAPAGGRGLEMAIALHAAGLDVAICPAHRKLAELILGQEGLATSEGQRALASVLDQARSLDPKAAPRGVMIAAKPDGAGGVVAALIERFEPRHDVRIIFTGYLPEGTPARHLVESGRAQFIRWNVHPRCTDLVEAIAAIAPRYVMPAFLPLPQVNALAAQIENRRLVRSDQMQWPD